MQTTLLGLAIALILALVTALVGPMLVDWGTYRALFESQASRLAGVDVRVTGAIEAQLLPSPRLILHDIEVGSGTDKMRAGSLRIEFALGPLMRGEWRADEMHLSGPRINLGLDASGRLQGPSFSVAFNPDDLSIDRLGIEGGTITLADAASGTAVTFDHVYFNGEARSLLGPFKGEGAVSIGGERYPYRLFAGRAGDDGALRLRLNVDPESRPLSIEADGALTVTGSAPRFEGMVTLAKPVGIRAGRGAEVTQPWRVSAKVSATSRSALMQNVEFLFGSEERGVRLTGDAEFTFGKKPQFNSVLSGRQIDLDRLLIGGDGVRVSPAVILRQLVDLGAGLSRPPFPVQVGIGLDQVTIGGSGVQNVRGDLSSDAGGWNLGQFEFRAPGFTQVRLNGHLSGGGNDVTFTGPVEIDARDPRTLMAWLEGRGEAAQGDLRALSLRGDITVGSARIAVDRLNAEFDRKHMTGHLTYVFAAGNQPPKLDAELNAPVLDIDAVLGLDKVLRTGSSIAWPHEATIAVDIGRATYGAFTARKASARVKVDRGGLQIDQLAVADLGGAAFSAHGHIGNWPKSPQGNVDVSLVAPDLTPVFALLSRFAPETARVLEPRAAAMAPARLHARFGMEGGASATLAVEGSVGRVRVALNGGGRVDPATMTAGDLKMTGRLEADDGRPLIALLGLDRFVAVDGGRGVLTIDVSGPARGTMKVAAKLAADGLSADAGGTARLFADKPSADLRVSVARANAAPLRGTSGPGAALPVVFSSHVTLAGNDLTLNAINAGIGGARLRGKLALALGPEKRVEGDIDADNLDGPGLLAAAIGMPAPAPAGKTAWSWSSEPFVAGALDRFTGRVAVKARRIELVPRQTAREFRAVLNLRKGEIAVDDMAGDVAGGPFTGNLTVRATSDGLKAHTAFSLAGADAASVLGGGARPAVTGTLGLSGELEGIGLSPVALIGSLQGKGTITLADAQLAGLDPHAFDAVTRAVDRGLAVDAERISAVVGKALESGHFSLRRAQGTIAVSAGQVRLGDFKADGKDAALTLSGNLDLTDGQVDARLVLSGTMEAAGSRPDIYMALKGPLTAAARSIDLSALSGWLTLRAVERQATQLRAIEQAAPKPDVPAAIPVPWESPPLQPPLPPAATQALPLTADPAPSIIAPERPALRVPSLPGGQALPGEQAPVLPPPLEIGPLPVPSGTVRR